MAYAPDPLLKCVLPPEIRSHFYFIISAEHSLSAKPINFLCSNSQGPFSLSLFLSFFLSIQSLEFICLFSSSPSFLLLPPSLLPASPSLSLPHSQCMNEFQFIQLHEPPRTPRVSVVISIVSRTVLWGACFNFLILLCVMRKQHLSNLDFILVFKTARIFLSL